MNFFCDETRDNNKSLSFFTIKTFYMLFHQPKQIVLKPVLLLAICSLFLSFIPPRGGDVFKIYLNNKMVVEQAVHNRTSLKVLTLDQRNYNDQVSIYYSHCGLIGKGRHISIRDAQNREVKAWKFADTRNEHTPMVFQVKDILNLQKGNGEIKLTIMYASLEMPKGLSLASIIASRSNKSLGAP